MDIKQLKIEAKQMEAENEYFKQQMLSEELRARYQKAIFDKMDFFIKWHEIAEQYNALLDKHMPKPVVSEDAVLKDEASELQEELDEIKAEAKVVSI